MTTTALAPAGPASRTTIAFTIPGDPWPVIAGWARDHGFLPRAPQTGDVKLFQKGSGLFTAPMRAEFTVRDGVVQLQAWVHVPLLSRVLALFILPAELPVQSGGFRGVLPRRIARNAINQLLTRVGAPLIP